MPFARPVAPCGRTCQGGVSRRRRGLHAGLGGGAPEVDGVRQGLDQRDHFSEDRAEFWQIRDARHAHRTLDVAPGNMLVA